MSKISILLMAAVAALGVVATAVGALTGQHGGTIWFPRQPFRAVRRRGRDLNPRRTFRPVRDFQSRSLDRSDTSPSGGRVSRQETVTFLSIPAALWPGMEQ
jgi:hypothetical protein